MKAEKDVESLIKDLKNKNKNIRKKAVEALAEIDDSWAVEPLIKALKDKDEDVRKASKEALEKIKKDKSSTLMKYKS